MAKPDEQENGCDCDRKTANRIRRAKFEFHTRFPPTPRVGLVCQRLLRPALILLFCEEVFSWAPCRKIGLERFRGRYRKRSRMRWIGQIFWLLAFGAVESF